MSPRARRVPPGSSGFPFTPARAAGGLPHAVARHREPGRRWSGRAAGRGPPWSSAHLVEPPIVGLLTGPVLDIRDFEVADVIALAESPATRALRLEALAALYLVEHMGTGSQREKAAAALDQLAGDPDPLVAAAAKQLKQREFDKSELFMRAGVLR